MMFVRFMINLFREVLRMKTFFDLKLSKFKQETMLSEKTSIFFKNQHLQLYV